MAGAVEQEGKPLAAPAPSVAGVAAGLRAVKSSYSF